MDQCIGDAFYMFRTDPAASIEEMGAQV